MANDLKISISGIRGVVGQSLDLEHFLGWVLTWENSLPEGPIVLARDARPHGGMLLELASGTLQYLGRTVLVAGLVPTPTVGVLVRDQKAAGGLMLTASHNPVEWNALKCFNHRGVILTPDEFARLQPAWEAPPDLSAAVYKPGGNRIAIEEPLKEHILLILKHIDKEKIAARKFKVVVDGCHSVGGVALPLALREVGVDVVELDCEPDGLFSRGLEPVASNLGVLCEAVRKVKADLGMAVDPDADRLALVSEEGVAIGEEYTLVLAADAILARGGKDLVANLSSTLILDAVAKKHGAKMHRSKVGEAHVMNLIDETGASIGGEGNGGVIFPAVQGGRDSLSGALLILDLLAKTDQPLSKVIQGYPPAFMVKDKIAAQEGLWGRIESQAGDWWPDAEVNRLDGLKWIWKDRWIHLRASNTEPIIRILAEGPSEEAALGLVDAFKKRI